MRKILRLTGCSLVLILGYAGRAGAAQADVCIAVDESRDTLSPQEQAAALLLVTRQFELAGERVVPGDCSTRYTLSHVMLGNTITVTLVGPNGDREGTALGLDDLPALYSQMVRSMVTGEPMSGMNVVDRTNVTMAQVSPRRVGSDRFMYARMGYGGLFGNHVEGTSAVGFGYRAELDSFGLDISFFDVQVSSSNGNYSSGATTGSLLKLEVLKFTNPVGNATAYFGGGVGWGGTDFEEGGFSDKSWSGSGLEGTLTVGYEFARATTLRVFTQVDTTLPFYKMTSHSPAWSGVTTGHQYAPSVVVSVGLAWQRGRHQP